MNITELDCDVEDFCQIFLPTWQSTLLPEYPRKRRRALSPAEVMTLLILFQSLSYRNFKHYYTHYVPGVLKKEFPNRVSY